MHSERSFLRPEAAPSKLRPLDVHPVDVPIDVLKGAIEHKVGQPVSLGIAPTNYFERDITRAVHGSGRFLVYGAEGSQDIWELPFGNLELEKLDPKAVYVQEYLAKRTEYTTVDERQYSRMLFADAEIKPLEDFTRNTITNILNVPSDKVLESGIDFSNVSRSQARRLIAVMRSHYASGDWQKVIQLGLAMSHIRDFVHMAREVNYRDDTNSTVTVADDHIKDELQAEFRTDVDLLLIRGLKAGIQELRADRRKHAAEHAEAWVSLLEENLSLDSFTPEVTVDDILKYPSYLNPRPDKGLPKIWSTNYLVGGTGSRNHHIKYPDGSVYSVDFPDHSEGARPIRGKEEEGYRGHISDEKLKGFNQKDEWHEWLTDFRDIVERHVSSGLVNEMMGEETSFKQNVSLYADVLRMAHEIVQTQAASLNEEDTIFITTRLAAILMAVQCVELTNRSVGQASALFEYSARGFGTKHDVEKEVGVSLSFGSLGTLTEPIQETYNEFGKALYGLELARLAEKYAQHPELATYIAIYRTNRELSEDAEYYSAKMVQAARRLMGDGKSSELAEQIFATGKYSNFL